LEYHPTNLIQSHFTRQDFTEQADPIMGAKSDEIQAGLRIIVSL
jgi:hypothetical protein